MQQLKKTLLIIDDDRLFCDSVKRGLTDLAVDVIAVGTGAEGFALAADQSIDIVMLDQKLPDGNGIQFCSPLLENNEGAKIIFITAFPSFENAVQAIKVGAYDYLSKPFEIGELHLAVSQALHTSALERVEQLQRFQQRQDRRRAVLIGADGGLKQVREMLELAMDCRSPVLITGETGTGKTILAKAIHFGGKTAKEAFIPINCAAIPENLMEAELFGHDKGAFTGAVSGNKGLFEMADQGTLFLDEIGEMPIHLQAKLLGVLDDHRIRRIGGRSFKKVDVRIITATNTQLDAAIADRRFREDLYYRLSVVHIHMPPLRERLMDIPMLCDHFISQLAPDQDIRLPAEQLEAFTKYRWPGNIRELRNILERAIIVRKENIIEPARLIHASMDNGAKKTVAVSSQAIKPLKQVEQEHITAALRAFERNYSQTAKALGISRSTLMRKLNQSASFPD